jgi:hypothetical protein
MPAGLRKLRRWLRACQDLYAQGHLTKDELNEARRSATTQAELSKAGAIVRQSRAAMVAAEAQRRGV